MVIMTRAEEAEVARDEMRLAIELLDMRVTAVEVKQPRRFAVATVLCGRKSLHVDLYAPRDPWDVEVTVCAAQITLPDFVTDAITVDLIAFWRRKYQDLPVGRHVITNTRGRRWAR